jgi:hypothetical protein
MAHTNKKTSFFTECDYSNSSNYAPVFNILTATTGLSSTYEPQFSNVYGSVIRTPLLNDVSSDEELNKIAASFSNELLPVWTFYNKNSKYFPVIFYRIPGKEYPFNTNDNQSELSTGILNEYINLVTADNNIRLITKYNNEIV